MLSYNHREGITPQGKEGNPMKFSKVEFNTKTKTAEIWNYTTENGNIVKSEKTMDMPLAQWADRHAVAEAMMTIALAENIW